jgi:hypothetical protein
VYRVYIMETSTLIESDESLQKVLAEY